MQCTGQGDRAICTLQWQRQRSIVRVVKVVVVSEKVCGFWPPVVVCCALCGLSGSISSKEVVCPFLPLPNPFLSFPFLHHLVHCHRRRQVHIRSFPILHICCTAPNPSRLDIVAAPPFPPSLVSASFFQSSFRPFIFPCVYLAASATPPKFLTTTLRHDKQISASPADLQTVITSDPDSHPDHLGHSSQRYVGHATQSYPTPMIQIPFLPCPTSRGETWP